MKLSSPYYNYTGTIYFELWRRQQEILKWEWDLQDEDDLDEARPEFEKDVKTKRYDLCLSILSGISKILMLFNSIDFDFDVQFQAKSGHTETRTICANKA